MQKVITINLNGRAYQLDEDAFELLRAYLECARLALAQNPDLAEIMADLEQAIAEKCQRHLSPAKTVVSALETRQILDEMGPVDGHGGAPADRADTPHDAPQASPAGDPPKRLYLLDEGAWLGGVCTGLAAYFKVDVTIVRVIFVAVAATTKGVASIVYAMLWFITPQASTSEEHAAAHGEPFNAQEIVDQVTAKAKHVAGEATRFSASLSADWQQQQREWKRQWRRERRSWKREWRTAGGWDWAPPTPTAPISYAAQVTAGVLVPVLTLVSAALFWIWAAAMMSLLVTGAIFGRQLPPDLPVWAAFFMLILFFTTIAWPIQHARQASHAALGGRHYYGGVAAWDGMMWLGFWLICGWLAYRNVPEVQQFFENLPLVRENLREIFTFRWRSV